MPKIESVLSASESALWLNVASVLHLTVDKAKRKIRRHGVGKIYANNGFVVTDTPTARKSVTKAFGSCIIVLADGTIVVNTPKCLGSERKEQKLVRKNREMRLASKERQSRLAEKETRRLFEEGSENTAGKKRQGKGNSLSDFGKYVNRPSAQAEPRAIDILVTIRVPSIR